MDLIRGFKVATKVEEAFARAKRNMVEPENPFLCLDGKGNSQQMIYPNLSSGYESHRKIASEYNKTIWDEERSRKKNNLSKSRRRHFSYHPTSPKKTPA